MTIPVNNTTWRTDVPSPSELKDCDMVYLKYLTIISCNHADDPSITINTCETTTLGRIEFMHDGSYTLYVPDENADPIWQDFNGLTEMPLIHSGKGTLGTALLHIDHAGIKNLMCASIIVTAWAPGQLSVNRCDEEKRYELAAYDKDTDVYDTIMYSDDCDELKSIVSILQTQHVPIVNADGTEPDWYSIFDTSTHAEIESFAP